MNRKRRSIVFLAVFTASFMSASILFGQASDPSVKEAGGMGYSMLGTSFLNLHDFNLKLESHGYPAVKGNFFSVGGGGHGIINNKFIIGGEGHSLLGESKSSGTYTSSLMVRYGFFDLGYIVYSIGDLRLYPLLGLGLGDMKFKISEKLTSFSFDDILDTPNRSSEISKSSFLINLAVGFDYFIKLAEDEHGRGGFLLGLRAGYCVSPFNSSWSIGDIEISGVPDLGFAGPYIRLMIGGGGIGKN